MKLANPKSKHIAKAAQGNASTKLCQRACFLNPKRKTIKSPLLRKNQICQHTNRLTKIDAKHLNNNGINTNKQGTTTHKRRQAVKKLIIF
jgi:hypothetical protein